MANQAVKYHRVHFRKSPDPTITLRVDPPVIACVGGKIPPNTKVYADFRVNGVLRKPDGLGPLFGTASGTVPDTAEYEKVRWLWNTTDPRFGFTIQRGTVLKDVTCSFTAVLDGTEYAATLQLCRIEQAAVGYELFSSDCEVRFGSDGKPNRESVGVTPYRLLGNVREPLSVNDDAGAEHYVIFRRNGHTGMLATSRAASTFGACSWARFDLVRREDVEMVSVGGAQTVGGYADSAILASCPVILTHDGTDGSSAAFTSIVFYRSDTQPSKPSGGTYENPVPTTPAGWSDAPPTGTKPLWMSRARFLPDTTSPDWSTPSSVQDSTGIEYIFSKSANPGTPANTHPFVATTVWTKDATDAVWMAIAVKNNGVWEAWKVVRIKGEKGDKGDNGLAGPPVLPPMHWDTYPDGTKSTTPYEFQDGKTAVDGSPATRLDCVVLENTAPNAKLPLCYYRCVKSHIKAADKKPGAETATDGPYWSRVSEYSALATDILLAENAFLRILSTQAIYIYKSDGKTVNAAFGGGSYPAWFGSATPDKAPLKIDAFGAIYAQKGVFEGFVLQKFRYIADSDAEKSSDGLTYTLKSDLNLICDGETVVLPTAISYAGYRVTLANNIEVYSRADHSTYVKTQDGSSILGFPKPQDTSSATSLPRPGSVTFPQSGSYDIKILRFITGVVEFIAIPNEAATKCRWYVTGMRVYLSDAY